MPEIKFKADLKNNRIIFSLNPKIYPLTVIHNTAFVFVDRAYIFLDGDPKKEINIFLKGKEKLSRRQLENLRGEFLNELLNNLIREGVSKKNKKTIEYIVGGAISAALEKTVIRPEAENQEMLEIEKEIAAQKKELEVEEKRSEQNNVLEIAKPYEKRYSKRK